MAYVFVSTPLSPYPTTVQPHAKCANKIKRRRLRDFRNQSAVNRRDKYPSTVCVAKTTAAAERYYQFEVYSFAVVSSIVTCHDLEIKWNKSANELENRGFPEKMIISPRNR